MCKNIDKCNTCGFGVESKINNELFMVLIFLLMILAPTSCHNFFWERNHVLSLLPTHPLTGYHKISSFFWKASLTLFGMWSSMKITLCRVSFMEYHRPVVPPYTVKKPLEVCRSNISILSENQMLWEFQNSSWSSMKKT